jgi:long-chain acyl-CoA synthetase
MNMISTTTMSSVKNIDNILNENDSHISYLPLAHMYEQAVHILILDRGAKIGYYSGDPMKLLDDV